MDNMFRLLSCRKKMTVLLATTFFKKLVMNFILITFVCIVLIAMVAVMALLIAAECYLDKINRDFFKK